MKDVLPATVMLTPMILQSAMATDTYAYSRQGQGAEQQSRGDYECQRWANQQSG